MQEAAEEGRCRCCGVEVEQPKGGSRRKLFCSDEHRLRYWRERRKQGLPTGEEGEERPADARTLAWELQATLQGFERTVAALARALAEAGDLDAVRAAREQVEAEAQRHVAAAEERRARAERQRLDAEALAEAAEAEVGDAHGRVQELEARAREAESATRGAEERLEREVAAVHEEAQAEVARAREDARLAVASADAEARHAAEVADTLRAQLQVVDRELGEERRRGVALEQRLVEAGEAESRRTAEHARQVEALQERLRSGEAGVAQEREARLRAEEQARSALALADERARERDRLLEAAARRRTRRRPRRDLVRPSARPS